MSEGKTTVDRHEYDEDFFEWEERDDSVSYINHCIGNFNSICLAKTK